MMQEFVDQIRKAAKAQMRSIHTAFPGKIVSFDPETGLATVLPEMMYKAPNGSSFPYPQISEVPVMFPQSCGQEASIAYPIKAGDGCLVIIAEKSIDFWLKGHETETDLAFDLTNAICIPGLFSKSNGAVKEACETDSIIIKTKSTTFAVNKNGVNINADKVTIVGDLDVTGTVSASNI